MVNGIAEALIPRPARVHQLYEKVAPESAREAMRGAIKGTRSCIQLALARAHGAEELAGSIQC